MPRHPAPNHARSFSNASNDIGDAVEVDENVIVNLYVRAHCFIAVYRRMLHPEQVLQRQIHVRIDEITLNICFDEESKQIVMDTQALAAWSNHLKTTVVCEPGNPEHPCPVVAKQSD